MARLHSRAEPVLQILLMLVLLTGLLSSIEGLSVVFTNNMPQQLGVGCHSQDGQLPIRVLNPTGTYVFDVPGHFFSGRKYTCTFSATAKPTTTLDVFVGWGGVLDNPCNCRTLAVCPWSVTANGFSCNNNFYSHGWGN